MQRALEIAKALCVRFEGVRLRPYLCPAGVPTIGVGSTRYLDGRRVTLLDAPISYDAAMQLLERTLDRDYLPAVQTLCPGIDTDEQMAALLDFTYNLGVGNLRNSTLRKKINLQDWDRVKTELRKWVRGGGRVLPGLVARREAEIALI